MKIILLGMIAVASFVVAIMVNRSGATSCGRRFDAQSVTQMLREQVQLYQLQHDGIPPDPDRFWQQMMHPTNREGVATPEAISPDFPLGPYVLAPRPNFVNNQIRTSDTPGPKVGWVYTVSDSAFELRAVNTNGDGVLDF